MRLARLVGLKDAFLSFDLLLLHFLFCYYYGVNAAKRAARYKCLEAPNERLYGDTTLGSEK